jgi:hypothetical protein
MEDYEIVELIAQGYESYSSHFLINAISFHNFSGYGIVLKALQKSTGQMVAIKQFRDSDSFVSKAMADSLNYLFDFTRFELQKYIGKS